MKLRDYQKRGVADLAKLFRKHRKIVAVAPTGSGKTVVASALLREMKPRRVLWLAHRIELLRQAREHIIAAGFESADVGILSGVEKRQTDAPIVVASVEMFRSRLIPKVDMAVVDEAHHVAAVSYREIVDFLPKTPVLGLTATPWRLDGEPLGDVFEHLHVIAEAVELIADGHIMQAAVYGIPLEKAKALVGGIHTSGADYSARKLESVMKRRKLMGDIVTESQRLAPGVPKICYATTLEHARAIVDRFVAAKRAAEYLDKDTPDAQRRAILERLASGTTEVVVNVGILTEGFDCPPVGCIVIARPTKSLTLYRQMCGRAARPWKGKKQPKILDHAGNAWRFGLPETPWDWSLEGRGKGFATGAAPVKQCPVCGAMIAVGFRECPECGADPPLSGREMAEQQAKLEALRASELERAAATKRVREIARLKGAGEDWVNKVIGAMFPSSAA